MDLVNLIKPYNKDVRYISSFDEIVNYLNENIESEDLVVSIGAGPINEVCFKLIDLNEQK